MIQTEEKRQSDQNKLIQYLDDFGKQISSRKLNGGLEEQLSSLSRNYNLAQQKLLETEKALMAETIVVQKQRSVIQLYKYIIGQDLDDEGTLSFLQHLEEQESNTEIYEELAELKSLLGRKKLRQCRRELQEQRSVRDLKKEVQRLQEECKNTDESSMMMGNELNELKQHLSRASIENQGLNIKLVSLRDQISRISDKLQFVENELCEEKVKRAKCENECLQLNKSIQKLKEVEKQNNQMQTLLANKLNWHSHTDKENNSKTGNRDFIAQASEKLTQLVKYKHSYKKIKENIKDCQLFKREISLMKLFLSEQALCLIKEFQTQPLDCLETELRNLAAMEKNNLLKLQESQRQVWKYRLQLMKQQELTANSHYQTLPLFRSHQPTDSNMSNLANAQLILSVQNPNCVSQFTSDPSQSPQQ